MSGINFLSSGYVTFGHSPVAFLSSPVNMTLSCSTLFYLVPTRPGLVPPVLSASLVLFCSMRFQSSLLLIYFSSLSASSYPYHTVLLGSILLLSVPEHSIGSALRDLFPSRPALSLRFWNLPCALTFG